MCRSGEGLQRTLEGSIRHMVAAPGLASPGVAAEQRGRSTARRKQPADRASFEAPEPFRASPLAWRVTHPRSGAIDVIRLAILGVRCRASVRSAALRPRQPAPVTTQSTGWSWSWMYGVGPRQPGRPPDADRGGSQGRQGVVEVASP